MVNQITPIQSGKVIPFPLKQLNTSRHEPVRGNDIVQKTRQLAVKELMRLSDVNKEIESIPDRSTTRRLLNLMSSINHSANMDHQSRLINAVWMIEQQGIVFNPEQRFALLAELINHL